MIDERKQLSLCMITKNDEKYLFDCLQNMKDAVDEVIIVDIGSDDQTLNIARQSGAKVYPMKWDNSFSKAKNICLDHANGRWILFLQANESISKDNLKNLKTLLDNPNAEGYLLYSNSHPEGRGISSPAQSLRLFRNRKEYRYQYQSFDLISYERMANIKDAYIQIEQQDDSSISWQIRLQILLLQEDVTRYPEDCYVQYMYGLELLNQQKYEEGITYLQKACSNLNLGYLFAPHLYKCLSWAFLYFERYSEALTVLNEGVYHFPFYTDLLVIRGEVHKQLKQYSEALQDLETCLELRDQPNLMVTGPEIEISVILETLGEINELILNNQRALACYQHAYELDQTNQDLLDKIAELAQKVDSAEVIENSPETAVEYSLSGLECVRWSQGMIKEWEEWIGKMQGEAIPAESVAAITPVTPNTPSKALLDYNHYLRIAKSNTDEVSMKNCDHELTCAEVHEEIASLYLNAHKVDMALSAYLRALQWNPQNERVQEKVCQLFNENSSELFTLFEKKKWILEGGWFYNKQAFENYVYGLIQFKNQQFEQACVYFSQISDDEMSYPILLAYLISSLWLGKKESEAGKRLNQGNLDTEMIALLFTIMKNYVLCRLDESQRQYPFSERIQREQERVRNLKYK